VSYSAPSVDTLRFPGLPSASLTAAIDRIDHYRPSVALGSRFPHAWLPGADSIFDHLGRDFTLVCTGGDPTPFRAAAERLGIPLTVLDLEEPVVAAEPRRFVLVRPDLYVGWSGDVAPGDVDLLLRTLAGTASRSPLSSAAS